MKSCFYGIQYSCTIEESYELSHCKFVFESLDCFVIYLLN